MIQDINPIAQFIFVENTLAPCEVILVPGGSRPQLAELAAKLYHQGMAKYILFSGHTNWRIPHYPSEAEYLKSIAVGLGVPDENVICEPRAAHTFQNAAFSLEILQTRGFKIEKFILVCKAFHSRRALLTYQHVFPKGVKFFVNTTQDTTKPSPDNWTSTQAHINLVMSEVEKIGKYFSDKIELTGQSE